MKSKKKNKFDHNWSFLDVLDIRMIVDMDNPEMTAVSLLKLLQTDLRNYNVAPLPKDLECSLFCPALLDLRPDEEYVEIYIHDLAGTVEECIARLMCLVLSYERVNSVNVESLYPCSYSKLEGKFNYDKLDHHIQMVIQHINQNMQDGKDSMESFAYLYIALVDYANILQFNLNVFIKWYARYKRITAIKERP